MFQLFQMPSRAAACAVARALQASGVTSRAGVRHEQAFVAVRSERLDIVAMVQALVPVAVPVAPPHDTPLSA